MMSILTYLRPRKDSLISLGYRSFVGFVFVLCTGQITDLSNSDLPLVIIFVITGLFVLLIVGVCSLVGKKFAKDPLQLAIPVVKFCAKSLPLFMCDLSGCIMYLAGGCLALAIQRSYYYLLWVIFFMLFAFIFDNYARNWEKM